MLYKEILIGFLPAGSVAQLGDAFFNGLFLKDSPALHDGNEHGPQRPARSSGAGRDAAAGSDTRQAGRANVVLHRVDAGKPR